MSALSTSTLPGPIRAILVDDDPCSLLILEALADSLSLETVTATNVAGAKKLLTEFVPHIAILDILLPDGDGVDILLEIRRAQLPTAVALITATLEEFPFHKCEVFQPDIILSKPLDPPAISKWIAGQIVHIEERMKPWEKMLIRDRLS